MGWAWAPRIYNQDHIDGWKKVTQAVHDVDGKIFCQLWHMGRVTHSTFHGLQPVGPSAVIANGAGTTGGDLEKHAYECPRELSVDDIKKVVEEWRHAAQCAKEAGFDGVEIHSANGYLLDLFLSVSPAFILMNLNVLLHSSNATFRCCIILLQNCSIFLSLHLFYLLTFLPSLYLIVE